MIIKRCAKYFSILSTFVGDLLIFFSLWMIFGFSSFDIFAADYGILLLIGCLCVPISIRLSIYLMWFKYRKEKYKHSLIVCAWPFVILTGFSVYIYWIV